MASIDTIQVLWPAAFGREVVTINASDFDPKIHQRPDSQGVDAPDPAPVAAPALAVEKKPAPKKK